MSATGLGVFDKTLQLTNIWLNEVGESLGDSKPQSYHALRAVLFTLRDRLPAEEAFHLSAQLPMLIRGIYWDEYRPTGKPEKLRNRDEFRQRVSERLDGTEPLDPDASMQAVFGVLERHVTKGELAQVKQHLPEDVRALFVSD